MSDPMGSEAARVARYAEAIYESRDKPSILEAQTWAEMTAGAQRYWHAYARGAMAVADEEHAALVAEVERLRKDNGELTRRWFQQNEWRADAEAKVAKVEETIQREGKLHSTWDKRSEMVVPVDALRAVLADAPTEQPCRACPGCGRSFAVEYEGHVCVPAEAQS